MTPVSAKRFSSGRLGYILITLTALLTTTILLLPHPDTPHSFKSNFPFLVIRVHQDSPMDIYSDVYVNATMGIIAQAGVDKAYARYFPKEPSKKKRYQNTYTHPFDNSTITETFNVGIHVRGQSTRDWPKKQYAVKFFDEDWEDDEVSLFGMPSGSKFILSSGGTDPTMVRNSFGFYLWQQMGMYAPRIQYVEVFVVYGDEEVSYPKNYAGVYMFTEKIARDKNRVDIKKMDVEDDADPEDITGGYIFKVDKSDKNADPSDVIFATNYTRSLYMVYPSGDVASQAKLDYLRSYINQWEELLKYGPNNGTSYSDLIVVHSFVDTFIIQEFSKNVDAYRLSSYFYKDRNKQIASGPIWDLDRTWGNSAFDFAYTTDGWIYDQAHPIFGGNYIPFWWPALMNDTKFVNSVSKRYAQLRAKGQPLSDSVVFAAIDNLHKEITSSGAGDRDFYQWGPWWYRFAFFWPDYHTHYHSNFKAFARERLKWMDRHIYSM